MSKVKLRFVMHTHFQIDRVLIKMGGNLQVSNLILEWCNMSFYLILFKSEIGSITSLDSKRKWVCTFQMGISALNMGSNSMLF